MSAETFESQLFGECRRTTKEDDALIEKLADECPHALFGAVNRRLNKRGLCILVTGASDTTNWPKPAGRPACKTYM